MPEFIETLKKRGGQAAQTFKGMIELIPEDNEKMVYIPCLKLIIDENQPFRLYTEDEIKNLAEMVKQSGLINPIIVRPAPSDKYEVLSGRNRAKAVMLNGDSEIKAFIRDVDDDTAALIMLHSNLGQRENLLPSEKAKAYRMEVEILYRRGKRPDSSSSTKCTNLDAREIVAAKYNEGRSNLSKYIRLTYLIPELLTLVDEKKLIIATGVDLSYLDEKNQKELLDKYLSKGVKLSKEQVAELKSLSKENQLNSQTMAKVLKGKEKPPKPTIVIKFTDERFTQFSDIIANDPNVKELIFSVLLEYKNRTS